MQSKAAFCFVAPGTEPSVCPWAQGWKVECIRVRYPELASAGDNRVLGGKVIYGLAWGETPLLVKSSVGVYSLSTGMEQTGLLLKIVRHGQSDTV